MSNFMDPDEVRKRLHVSGGGRVITKEKVIASMKHLEAVICVVQAKASHKLRQDLIKGTKMSNQEMQKTMDDGLGTLQGLVLRNLALEQVAQDHGLLPEVDVRVDQVTDMLGDERS